jgi:hypothetical protein
MPDLNPDGPHSPERTAEVAALFDACSRYLTYATMSSKHGLESPSEAYRLLGELYSATGRLPQLCGQLTGFLAAQGESGTLADDHGLDVATQIAEASYHLGGAHGAAEQLTKALQRAQQSISGLYVKETPETPAAKEGET